VTEALGVFGSAGAYFAADSNAFWRDDIMALLDVPDSAEPASRGISTSRE
jgi:hypothetical protein